MPKVRYTEAKGLIQQAGGGFHTDDLPYSTVQAKTASFTASQPGVYTISGSTATLLTGTLPLATAVPGGLFVFRYSSADAHVLTASDGGTEGKLFKSQITGSENQTAGSKLQIAGAIGNSVALLSDGKNYLVLNSSGSLLFSGN